MEKQKNQSGIKSRLSCLSNLKDSFFETANSVEKDGSIILMILLSMINGQGKKIPSLLKVSLNSERNGVE